MMKEKGTVFSDHTYIKKVEGRTIYADKNGGNIQFNDVDLIVVSTGMRSFNPLKDELGNDIPVYIVGDAQKTGNAQDAIYGAYEQAIKL